VAVVGAGLSAVNLFVMRPSRAGAVRELVDAVEQCDQPRLDTAIAKVKRLGASEQAAAEVGPLLHGTDWTICSYAAHALANLDQAAAPELIRVIERQVTREGEQIRNLTDLATYVLCLQTPGALRRLCEAARNHADGRVRGTLISTLAVRYPPDASGSPFPDLEMWARSGLDSAATLRAQSAFKDAAPTLRETFLAALADVDPNVRASAAGALGQFRVNDPHDLEVWTELTHALKDDDFSVRIAATLALAAIDQGRAPFALPTVLAALESPDPHHWVAAASAVQAIDPTRFPEVWPALRAAMRGDSGNVRVNAILAIQSFGAAATPAVPDLIQILSHRKANWDTFSFALPALTTIGVEANDARVETFYLAKIGDTDWHGRALWELIGFARKGSQPSLEALTAALEHKDYEVRNAAAICLGLVGPPGKIAIPDLKKALQDENDAVRRSAAEALGKISPPAGGGQGSPAPLK
jgi:HEAT repeat protein